MTEPFGPADLCDLADDALQGTRRANGSQEITERDACGVSNVPTSFLSLETCDRLAQFSFPVTSDLCVGPRENRFLFGGIGLGAALLAMERVVGRPPVCASAQFVSFARSGERLSLAVRILAAGRLTSQAAVTGVVGDRLVFSVTGALGRRLEVGTGQWPRAPDIPGPEACSVVRHWHGGDGAHAKLDIRLAMGRYGHDRVGKPAPNGRLVLWVRPRSEFAIDVAFLAMIADLVPDGIGNALGANIGGNSLDNVLRIVAVRPTPWVMVDILISAIDGGIAHGSATLSTEDGAILAHGSQSIIVRPRANRR